MKIIFMILFMVFIELKCMLYVLFDFTLIRMTVGHIDPRNLTEFYIEVFLTTHYHLGQSQL